jgi:uncharacterized protein (TIGR03086 family)
MIDVLAGITDDQLAGATPCDDFTVADLVGHVNTSAIRLGALARREAAEEPGDSSRELIGQHVRALATAWQEPSAWQGTTDVGIELTNEVWGRIALTEMVVHGWDLATATGQPFELPDRVSYTTRSSHDHVRPAPRHRRVLRRLHARRRGQRRSRPCPRRERGADQPAQR